MGSKYRRFINAMALIYFAWQCSLLELSGAQIFLPHSQSCSPQYDHPIFNVDYPKDRGGMNSLLQTAKSSREAIFNQDLPYQTISAEISRVYNNHSALNMAPFLKMWVEHSLNALLLAGFVVFVGLVLPGSMVAMWMFWECCYEVDEEDEEDSRHLSWKALAVTWSLAVGVALALLLLTIFLLFLLVANGWMSTGVREGGGVTASVLPELVRLRDQSKDQVTRVTRDDLYALRTQLHNTILSNVSYAVVSTVNSTFSPGVNLLYANISGELSLVDNINRSITSLVKELQAASANTSRLGLRLKNAGEAMSDVIAECDKLLELGVRDLEELCNELAFNQERYIPRLSVGIISLVDAASPLVQLKKLVNNPLFVQKERFSEFADFLAELSYNLSVHVNVTSDAYFGENSALEQRLANFHGDVVQFSSSFSFGLPHSQDQLTTYLGERFLINWDMFRSVGTVTFVLFTLLLGMCLLVAMGMGLWHVTLIYRSGEEEEVNIEGAHQAGTMIKKLAFWFYGTSVVSAVFYGVFLCMVGVVDQGCGRHGNFSNIMLNVIDNNQSWRESYPLGATIMHNASYPLTVSGVLNGCRRNRSLFTVLQLEHQYNLSDIINIPENESINYMEGMRSVAESVAVFSVFPTTNELLLLTNNTSTLPVNWSQLTSLTVENLFQDEFVGLTDLRTFLDNMTTAALNVSLSSLNLSQSAISNLTTTANSSVSALDEYLAGAFLPQVKSLSTSLRGNQTALTNDQLPTELANLNREILSTVPPISREQLHLAANKVTSGLANFISLVRGTLLCETGFCHPLAIKYDQFSSALCNDIVQGMDVYWVTLAIVLALSLTVMLISLILASQFIDLELEKSNRNNRYRFHLASAVIRQIRAMFWFILTNAVNLWLVVVISRDEYFHEAFCVSQPVACCPTCVWGFGILFLLLSVVMGGVGRGYQCVVLHRINKFEVMKLRKYWMDKKKATQFYAQLIHFIQDVLFLIIAGAYINGIGTLTIPSFFSLSLSIIGVISYVIYLIVERNYIPAYFQWLRTEISKRIKFRPQGVDPPTGSGQGPGGQGTVPSRHRAGGRYGSSESEQSDDDSQGTTQPDADWMYNPNHHMPPGGGGGIEHIPLPVIPEGSENMDQTRNENAETSLTAPPPPPSSSHPNGVLPMAAGSARLMMRGPSRPIELDQADDSDLELSQIQPNMSSIPLDNLNHGDYTASQIRLHRQQLHRGISSRHSQYAASTASYYSSSNSLTAASEMQQGYYSSSQAPDDHYDSSDYRDDYDSDYSHGYSQRYLNRRYLPPLSGLSGEMSVEV